MKRRDSGGSDWRRYLRPPPPTPWDVRAFTWGVSVLGVLMFVAVLAAKHWVEVRAGVERGPRSPVGAVEVRRP